MATATKRSFKDKARDKLGNIGTKIRGSSLESPTEGNVGANPSGGVIVEASTSPPLRSPITLVNTDLSEVGGNESNGGKDIEKKKRHVTQPKGTIPYDVTTSDTLEGIAARFDTTPTNLIKLNKLHLRMVFPGQTIYIPDKDYVPSDPPTPDEPNKSSPTNNKLKSPPPLKSPGHAERVFTDSIPEPAAPKPLSEDDAKKLDQECYARFIKINVKHITDGQGVVNGVLLVTPNAVMFDPNVSDPLVIESGADAYGMIAPMETIISAAMYHDIAAMRIRSAKDQGEVRKKSEVYHAKDCPLYTSKESSNDKNTASEKGNNKEEETQEKSDGNKEQTDEPPREKSCSCGASDPAANIDLTNRKSDSHSDSNTLNDEKGNLEESAVNETKVDSEPTIGANEKKELVPKPAPVSENPPLYLSLRVGKPINKRVSKTCPIESYGKKNKPEYWFSIPRDRVDHLYAFFVQWSPNIYGSEEEINPEARGFVVFDSDAEDLNLVDDYFEGDIKVSKDWEIVKVEEARRRLESFELGDLPLPELIGTTTLLDDDKISKLCKHLPPRTEGYPWVQIYSTDHHGFSLNTLYRHMQGYDTPVLIVVKDTGNNIFGAMTSCPLKVSEHFYGTGESFLYTFTPEFKVYTWTGDNTYFNKGNLQSLVIGAGDGSFGLWLDGDIYHGRTQHCDTYDNEPLTTQEDFIVKGIEVWGFE
ncbi:unnamed protein product [Owenia fusiformis]|uniref:Oxidation resistance protein 1 n=1 Tax=Owenia fusiformis TaxID=6347 RepID=A0A8S4N0D4_OWEFU|nr:unnamed protein product [Owenia fusiformis]